MEINDKESKNGKTDKKKKTEKQLFFIGSKPFAFFINSITVSTDEERMAVGNEIDYSKEVTEGMQEEGVTEEDDENEEEEEINDDSDESNEEESSSILNETDGEEIFDIVPSIDSSIGSRSMSDIPLVALRIQQDTLKTQLRGESTIYHYVQK